MAERPLLLLPEPAEAARAKKRGGGEAPTTPGRARQQERIGPRLDELEAAFEAKRMTMQTAATGLAPEDVLVLETAGTVEDFFKAAAKIEGLEFLAEYDEEDIPPDDDFFLKKVEGVHEGYRGRVYLVFANHLAFRQLLRLWGVWQRAETFERGLTKWRDVFKLLRDIRPWSIKDRLEETGVLDDWRERLEHGREFLPCEIELWFRSTLAAREQASFQVRERIEQLGGEILSESVVEEIHYHAFAVRLPVSAIQDLLDQDRRREIALVQSEQIQFFRASGQMAGRINVENVAPLAALLDAPVPDRTVPPVVALLDGLPLQAHRALVDRLSLDDPDDLADDYEARFRIHGTAMASLIIWGDLHAPGDPIPQPLYIRPIMQPYYPPEGLENLPPEERVPENTLIVDLIHRTVRRIFEGDGSEPAAAPNVVAINLSLGIADRPFSGTMSPLARLLDWLSWKYGVLFLVSAGNHGRSIDLGCPWGELCTEPLESIQTAVVRAIAGDNRHRRLLSPAEGMNILTVGAIHDDQDASATGPGWVDPVRRGFPSPVNAQGQGYRRSIKPDVLAPGGRVALRRPLVDADTQLSLPGVSSYRPGQLVATPGATEGNIAATVPNRGTSNATALLTRAAALLVPVLDELRELEGGQSLDSVPDAVWLKALLVHGARWGEPGEAFKALFRSSENGDKLAEYLTRLLGYGVVDFDIVRECTATRVTALAGGRLRADAGYEHRFPLPPSLSGKRGWKQLVVTLAWMTPVSPLNHRWRRAHLWFSSPKSKMEMGSNGHLRRIGACADWQAVQRGTVQHEVFEGTKAAAFVDGDEIVILVSCREDAKVLGNEVPYTLAVTLEVDESIGVDIYTEVRERVQTRLRVAAAGDASF